MEEAWWCLSLYVLPPYTVAANMSKSLFAVEGLLPSISAGAEEHEGLPAKVPCTSYLPIVYSVIHNQPLHDAQGLHGGMPRPERHWGQQDSLVPILDIWCTRWPGLHDNCVMRDVYGVACMTNTVCTGRAG